MSGSNIRIDTSGEQRDVIRISVDDIFLNELQDVDINMQPTQGQIMAFDTALGATGISGAFRAVSFGSAFSGDTLQVAGLSSSGAVTGSSMTLTGSQGIVFQDGTIQTTAAYQSVLDFEVGVAYEALIPGTEGITNPNFAYLGANAFATTGWNAGDVDVFYAGFSGEAGASGAGNYFLAAKSGDHLHIVGQDSGAKVIGRLVSDTFSSSDLSGLSAHGLAFQTLVGNSRAFTPHERVTAFYTVGGDTVLTYNGATGDVTGVASFNGSTGAVTGVGSFNGSTGAVTGVASFNGSTGAVTGVASVNGSTGDIVGIATTGANVFTGTVTAQTGITLGNGITFPDGTFQSTAMRAGLKYTVTTSVSPSAGGVYVVIDGSGVLDSIIIHDTDANGNDIGNLLDLFADNGGYIQLLEEDGSVLTAVAVEATETGIATFVSDKLSITQVQGSSGTFEVDGAPSDGDVVFATIIPNLVNAVQTVGGFQGNIQIYNLIRSFTD